MSEEKKTCIFGETLEGGYPKMLVAVLEEAENNRPTNSVGDYVLSCLEDLLAALNVDRSEVVTIEFTARKMTQEEIDALPDL